MMMMMMMMMMMRRRGTILVQCLLCKAIVANSCCLFDGFDGCRTASSSHQPLGMVSRLGPRVRM